jgi:hypothetical protein
MDFYSGDTMPKTLNDWLQEGEEVYQGAVQEYRQIEEQLRDLATHWRAKKAEIDRIAAMLGKTPLPEEQGGESQAEGEDRGEKVISGPRMNLGGPAVRR